MCYSDPSKSVNDNHNNNNTRRHTNKVNRQAPEADKNGGNQDKVNSVYYKDNL